MKKRLEQLLAGAVGSLREKGVLDRTIEPPIQVERCRDPLHGDFASNLAMMLAKPARKNPRDLAALILESLPESPIVARTEIAGPGFINFFIDPRAQFSIIRQVHEENSRFGRSRIGAGSKVQVEFVSANPTGPLHVGHGRGAAYGSAVASLLQAAGFEVHREYYVNDAGRQMDILATSIWLRYLERCGEVIPFPVNAYRGNYVREIARTIHHRVGEGYRKRAREVLDGLPVDEADGGDKEEYIDAMIERCRTLLGTEGFAAFLESGLDDILGDIRSDLEEFGVHYDQWFSERRLTESGAVRNALEKLRSSDLLFEKDGATWFACARLGDEKDRVVIRENGQPTYLASDIAYHLNKIERGFDLLIDVWGADHHGYVPRIRAAVQAFGADPSLLSILLVQFAVLYRGREKVSMSTRSGEFVTLRELRNEVGRDAARFFYLMRRCEQHMDFDLDLARSQSSENPVYYVQYAHARICSVFRKLDERNWSYDPNQGMAHLELLTESQEQELINRLSRYPETLESAARKYEPHLVIQYLRDLANDFHKYNDAHRFLVDRPELRNARLNLIAAVRQVIANALGLLGISAPEAM